jgi:hypothetical protein
MSDQTQTAADFQEKMWKILNLQADTMLKVAQTKTETWKVVVSSMTAGGAIVVALVALLKAFS